MQPEIPRVMLLAAGRGARCRPVTDHTPKPLLSIGNTSLIEHLLAQLKEAGFTQVVINLGHLGQKLYTTLGDGHRYGVAIEYSWEDPVLETAGGVIQALPLLGNAPFIVVSADLWTDYPFAHLKDVVLAPGFLAHTVLVPNPPHHPAGDFSLEGQTVILRSGTTYNYAGIGLYHPDFFAGCTPGVRSLGPMLATAVQEGQVQGERYTGLWVNVGTLDILEQLAQKLQADAST